jgi:hypothetical protein
MWRKRAPVESRARPTVRRARRDAGVWGQQPFPAGQGHEPLVLVAQLQVGFAEADWHTQ